MVLNVVNFTNYNRLIMINLKLLSPKTTITFKVFSQSNTWLDVETAMRNTYNLIRNKKKFKRMMEREINAEKKRFEFFHVSLLKLLNLVRSVNSYCKTPLSLNFQDVP